MKKLLIIIGVTVGLNTSIVAGPIFSFGVVADCQYCNIKVPKTAQRQYALSLKKLTACVEHLNRLELRFVVHLGDFIDRDFNSFADVAPIYDKLKADHYHVLGNHDFSVADEYKAKVPAALGLKSRYYQFRYHGYRFIAMDGNDVSLHAYPASDPRHKAAEAFHKKLPSGTPSWNGAVGQAQLDWLKKALNEAKRAGERVILFCHFPVYPENVHNLWNAAEVLAVVRESRSVVAYMNGHNHAGNYGLLAKRHFVTFTGMVDTEETAYAVVNVHADRLEIKGFGRQKNMTLPIAGNGGGNETVDSRITINTAGPDIALATDGALGAAELQKSNDLRSWRRLGDVPAEASEVLVTPRESGNEFYRLKKK